jgi:hypothetical protein
MRALLTMVVTAVTVAVTSLGVAVPAHADFESTATAGPGRNPGGECYHHPIQYSVAVPSGTRSWSLDITVLAPGGIEHAVVTPNRFSGAPTTGSVEVGICPEDPEGTYTLQPVVTGWWDAQGVEHRTPVPGTSSTFEVGEIVPLACPSCEVSSRVTLRFVQVSGRWQARLALVNQYDGDRLRIWGAKLHVDRRTARGWERVSTLLTDRRGTAVLRTGLRPGRTYQASYGGGWIGYDADNRLSVPKARSPRVRLR